MLHIGLKQLTFVEVKVEVLHPEDAILFLPGMLNGMCVATMTDLEELLTPEQLLKAPIFPGEAEWGRTHRSLIVLLKLIVLPFHSLSEFLSPGKARNRKRQAEFSVSEVNLVTK